MPHERPTSVLVVDDEDAIRSSIAELLAMEGFSTGQARNADEGLAFLSAHPDTDIVLLDINLGTGMSGMDVLPRIREEYRYTQVIMFTSIDALDAGVECMKRGAFDYMTKPFQEDEFYKRVAGALERKRMARLNDLYLGILVHDLKNPLQCIIGTLEFLRDTLVDKFEDSHHRMMQVADSGVSQIKTIISNILGIAKMENGTLQTQPATFDLRREVEPVINVVRSRGGSETRRWNIDLPADDGFQVTSDRGLYLQVVGNILGNAVRFTPRDGTIAVRITTADNDLLQTSIMNTGSFIPPHLREAVFDKYAGVHLANDALKGQNFGLGLTFSKMAVEALGGRIWVDGDPDLPATTFHFTVRNFA